MRTTVPVEPWPTKQAREKAAQETPSAASTEQPGGSAAAAPPPPTMAAALVLTPHKASTHLALHPDVLPPPAGIPSCRDPHERPHGTAGANHITTMLLSRHLCAARRRACVARRKVALRPRTPNGTRHSPCVPAYGGVTFLASECGRQACITTARTTSDGRTRMTLYSRPYALMFVGCACLVTGCRLRPTPRHWVLWVNGLAQARVARSSAGSTSRQAPGYVYKLGTCVGLL
jgi:hypothetical protein